MPLYLSIMLHYYIQLVYTIKERPEDGRLRSKHVVVIAKTNVNGEINSYIVDGKLYKQVEYNLCLHMK
jgi:hypothetical protein